MTVIPAYAAGVLGNTPLWVRALLQADIAVSGASAGYFSGWSIALWRRYRMAPDIPTASAG